MRNRNKWIPLVNYEGHEISTQGEVRNIRSGTILKTSVNQTGVRYVSIRNTSEQKYQNRALSILVAEAFCNRLTQATDTVLHLDGDISNVEVGNLMWASRWHTIAYHKEIVDPRYSQSKRIRDDHNNSYRSLADAARATGCLPSSIEYAIRYNNSLVIDEHLNFTQRVEPGGHIFRS